MSFWKRLFQEVKTEPATKNVINPVSIRKNHSNENIIGVKKACLHFGCEANNLVRAMCGSATHDYSAGKVIVRPVSWVLFLTIGSDSYFANVGADEIQAGTDTIRTVKVISPAPGLQRINSHESFWRFGPIGSFEIDFFDAIDILQEKGNRIADMWFQGTASYLLKKIRIKNKLINVWQIPTFDSNGVPKMSFVDAITGNVYVVGLSDNQGDIEIEPT